MNDDVRVSVCVPQAHELLQDLEGEVRQSLEKKYGEDESMTSLWNATMEEVSILSVNLICYLCAQRRLFDPTFKTFIKLATALYDKNCFLLTW